MFFVKQELSQAGGSGTLEASDHVPNLLDGLHLLFQEIVFKHLAKVGVVMLACSAMELQQALIDLFLQI